MAQISPARHFYLPNVISSSVIRGLQERYSRGLASGQTSRHAWDSILHVYFPDSFDPSLLDLQPGQTARGTTYTTIVQNFGQGSIGDGVTLERITVELPAHKAHHDNILLVKCNPPNGDDIQSQWNSAMRTVEAHLGAEYKDRPLYFILAVGLHWLPFYWDPTDRRPAGQALKMKGDGLQEVEGGGKEASGWDFVRPEVRAPPGVDAGHVDADGVVRTDRARSLDCITVAEPLVAGEMPRLAYQEDLDFLEEFLGVVERNSSVDESGWGSD